jgi:hypothetical protein
LAAIDQLAADLDVPFAFIAGHDYPYDASGAKGAQRSLVVSTCGVDRDLASGGYYLSG